MTKLILGILATSPALLAADPSAVPVPQVDLVAQASLISEIGYAASTGFDACTHARALRARIEFLLTRQAVTNPTASAENVTPAPRTKPSAANGPSTASTAKPNASVGPDPAALREAARLLRRKADEIEGLIQPAREP